MSNTITYVVNGDVEEVSSTIELARTESRFLSDNKNVTKFDWYPESDGQLTAEITVSEDDAIDVDDLGFLSAEYPSLFISISTDDIVDAVVMNGRIETLA